MRDINRILCSMDLSEVSRHAIDHAVLLALTAKLHALVPDDVRTWCYREILGIATEDASDLIVMGVHGRNALDLMLFGSTTNQVVRRATCPVLTLRTSSERAGRRT